MKKKDYLIIAAVAAMLAACADNGKLINEVKAPQDDTQNGAAICFSSYADLQVKTKAENNENAHDKWNLENHNTSFNIWAWKYYDGTWITPAVFTKGTVEYKNIPEGYQYISYPTGYNSGTEGKDWIVSPVKYWDKSADFYLFYAAAPAHENWVLHGSNDEAYLSYADFTLQGANNLNSTAYVNSFLGTGDVDLMIAEDNQVGRAYYNSNTPARVNEVFDHVLSRLNVTVSILPGGALAVNNANVKVTSFKIFGGNLKNKGSFDESLEQDADKLAGGTTKRWYDLERVNRTNNTPYDLVGYDISETQLTTSPLYIAQYLIIPQEIGCEVIDRAYPRFNKRYTKEEAYTYNSARKGVATGSITIGQINPATNNNYTPAECNTYNIDNDFYVEGYITTLDIKTPATYYDETEAYNHNIENNLYSAGYVTTLDDKVPAEYWSQADADDYNNDNNLQPGDADYKTTETVKTPAVKYTAIEAYNYNLTYALDGAWTTETEKTPNIPYTDLEAYNINMAMNTGLPIGYKTTDKINPLTNQNYTAEEAYDYNLANGYNPTGFKTTNDVRTPNHPAINPYFEIKYTINNEPYTAYYDLANAFGKLEDQTLPFCEGYQNTLNIKLEADVILFDAQVFEWTTKTSNDFILDDDADDGVQ